MGFVNESDWQPAAAMGAGYFGANHAHGVNGLPLVIEAHGMETLLGILTQYGIALKAFVNTNMHDGTWIKL